MPVLPNGKADKIQFCKNHSEIWTTNAVAMGSTAADVAAWQALVDAAEAAQTAAGAARDAAIAATNDYNNAVDQMTQYTSVIIKQVKTKAAISGDSIYSLANIPAPADPGPAPMPGTPYDFKTELDGNGALILKWKCDNPRGTSGTIYRIYRQLDGKGEFFSVGDSGMKGFTDNTIPAGTAQVTYQMQAARTTGGGMWASFTVRFGSAEAQPQVSEGEPSLKMAA